MCHIAHDEACTVYDTVVKYLDSKKSWVPGVGVVSPTASPASVDANPTNATARLTCDLSWES